MNNKPKIYAPCKAGCLWETVHKSEFEKSAAYIEQYVENGNCYFEARKEYKIFADKDADNQFACSVVFAYKANGTATTYTIAHTNDDKYADSFVFRLLEAATDGSTLTLVYEMAGIRYTETVSGTSLTLLDENCCYVSGASRVLLYNSDATITVETSGVDIEQTTGDSETAVMSQKATTEALDEKQALLESGKNIKTINGNSILGSGDIEIQGEGGGGTTVTVNGEDQTTWDADTKLDVLNATTNGVRVYVQNKTNSGVEHKLIQIATGKDATSNGNIVQYFSTTHAAGGSAPTNTAYGALYCVTPENENGEITKPYFAVNKKYLHDLLASVVGTKLYRHIFRLFFIVDGIDNAMVIFEDINSTATQIWTSEYEGTAYSSAWERFTTEYLTTRFDGAWLPLAGKIMIYNKETNALESTNPNWLNTSQGAVVVGDNSYYPGELNLEVMTETIIEL